MKIMERLPSGNYLELAHITLEKDCVAMKNVVT
jgi:hypothetical protein